MPKIMVSSMLSTTLSTNGSSTKEGEKNAWKILQGIQSWMFGYIFLLNNYFSAFSLVFLWANLLSVSFSVHLISSISMYCKLSFILMIYILSEHHMKTCSLVSLSSINTKHCPQGESILAPQELKVRAVPLSYADLLDWKALFG